MCIEKIVRYVSDVVQHRSPSGYVSSQQTQNILVTFVQRRHNVFDVGPTLYKCYTNVLCLVEAHRGRVDHTTTCTQQCSRQSLIDQVSYSRAGILDNMQRSSHNVLKKKIT